MTGYIRRQSPGSVVRLDVWRNRQRLALLVAVGRRTNPGDSTSPP